MSRRRHTAGLLLLALLLPVLGLGVARALDRAWPMDLSRADDLARVMLARDGRPLRYLLAGDDRLRLAVSADAVDPRFIAMLVAYEDARFWSHPGVDPLALVRATWQWLANGRVVSGASTLTMQTVRLLEPRPRTLGSKLVEMARALQLDWHLSKQQILALYLRLAPYGGNVEGIAAASRYYFGKSPARLTPGEAALLVALPQSPTRLRPDRHPQAALVARAKVLERIWPRVHETLGLRQNDLALARDEPIAIVATGLPMRAPHLADRLLRASGVPGEVRSCVDADLQARVAAIARDAALTIHARASIAVLVVENATSEVHAYLGGIDYLSTPRAGQMDLAQAVRSPGSTLKPLIYGLAFDTGLAAPATLVEDVPSRFGGYVPANFEGLHRGTVSLAEALQASLNVPAVALLDAIGPGRFVATLARHGTPLRLPDESRPGLAIALGGAGSTLADLVRLYRATADDGQVRGLRLRCDETPPPLRAGTPLLGADTRWHLARILRGVAGPALRRVAAGTQNGARIAWKTGTSYGYRDAWSIGFDERWTVGVWVGRADGTPLPGEHGRKVAAPILFRVFDELPESKRPPTAPPRGAIAAWDPASLPPTLRRLGGARDSGGPRVLFPLPGTSVLLAERAIPLQARGGTPPYLWIIDGQPLALSRRPNGQWQPPGPGFALATIVDATGRADRVRFRVTASAAPVGGRLLTTQ